MAKPKGNTSGGLVYSTDPQFKPYADGQAEPATLPAAEQRLRIKLETKHRGGKAVTLVEGFTGHGADQQELGKRLKAFCGTGGAVKEGQIIIQGDHRDKVLLWLHRNGYTSAKKC